MKPKVAIITLNYNGKENTIEFLESLEKLDTKGLEVKIVVVDNASTDDSVQAISKKFSEYDLVQSGGNFGFAGGFNRGIEYGMAWGADYSLVINNDTLIDDKNLLQKLVKDLEENSKIGMVAPKIYFAPGFEFHKDRYTKDQIGKVLWYAGGSFDWNNVMSVHRGIDEVDSGQYDQFEGTGFISGCCFLARREVFEKVGLFNDKLFAYMEDNDLLEKIKNAGFKLYYDGETSIYHKVSQSFKVGSNLADYFLTRNRLTFGFKYTANRTKFALFREALRMVIFGRPFQKRGVIDFLKGVTGAPADIIKPSLDPVFPIKLSVTIVNYNTSDLVKKLLESIFDKKSGINEQTTEVTLMDNGDLDPCSSFVKDFPKVRYLVNQENTGFSQGYNRTIRYSRGEYVLLLNSDIQVLEDSLSRIRETAEHKKSQAVIGGQLFYPNMTNQDSCYNLPTVWGAIKEYFLRQKGAYFMFLPKGENLVQVEGLVMACFLIPRAVLNKVGLLDEGTFMFFEDIEYCRRLKQNNIPIFFDPKAHFIHHHGGSTKKLKEGEAYKMLVKGSEHYHGKFYYTMLYWVLRIAQKVSRTKTPVVK